MSALARAQMFLESFGRTLRPASEEASPASITAAIIQVGWGDRDDLDFANVFDLAVDLVRHGHLQDAMLEIDDWVRDQDAKAAAVPRRQAAAASLRRARRAHRSSAGSLRRERPAWQRSGARWRGTRIEPAMTNPRARGQLSA